MSDLTRLIRSVLNTIERDLLRNAKTKEEIGVRVRGGVFLLKEMFGPLISGEELWKVGMKVVLGEGGAWDGEKGGLARVVLGWVEEKEEKEEGREELMKEVMRFWGDLEDVGKASERRRACEFCSLALSCPVSRCVANPTLFFLSSDSSHNPPPPHNRLPSPSLAHSPNSLSFPIFPKRHLSSSLPLKTNNSSSWNARSGNRL